MCCRVVSGAAGGLERRFVSKHMTDVTGEESQDTSVPYGETPCIRAVTAV